jgi:hypothetical protein
LWVYSTVIRSLVSGNANKRHDSPFSRDVYLENSAFQGMCCIISSNFILWTRHHYARLVREFSFILCEVYVKLTRSPEFTSVVSKRNNKINLKYFSIIWYEKCKTTHVKLWYVIQTRV